MTPLETAQAELAESKTPFPDLFMFDYTPQAGLLFGRQVAMCLLKMVTDAAASLTYASPEVLAVDAADDNAVMGALDSARDEEQPVVSEILNGVAMAVAGLTHSLVAIGLLPAEAEEALSNGVAIPDPINPPPFVPAKAV